MQLLFHETFLQLLLCCQRSCQGAIAAQAFCMPFLSLIQMMSLTLPISYTNPSVYLILMISQPSSALHEYSYPIEVYFRLFDIQIKAKTITLTKTIKHEHTLQMVFYAKKKKTSNNKLLEQKPRKLGLSQKEGPHFDLGD